MSYRLEDLYDVFLYLIKKLNVKIAIIGGVVISYFLGEKEFSEDLDLFVYDGSILDKESMLRDYAREKSWEVGTTEYGMPKISLRKDDTEIEIEFHENIYDFYISPEIIERSRDIRVRDLDLKILYPEYQIILKAKAGGEQDIETLRVYSDLVKEGKLRISINRIREALSYFPDEEKLILSRLRSAGFNV
ncbi:MAG: nucleotidyltransferase [Sulfolobales archaeon]